MALFVLGVFCNLFCKKSDVILSNNKALNLPNIATITSPVTCYNEELIMHVTYVMLSLTQQALSCFHIECSVCIENANVILF